MSIATTSLAPLSDTVVEAQYELTRKWAKLTIESVEDRLERYRDAFSVPLEHLKLMADSFAHELLLGLEATKRHPRIWKKSECSFKVLDSCIHNLPTGSESGIFYALDFGGTNFRVVRSDLKGNGQIEITQHKVSLASSKSSQKGLMEETATATEMFDFFASACKSFMAESGDIPAKKDLAYGAGFTFSFPCNQRSINSATLMEWTKGFATGRKTRDPIEGLDVVALMQAAFDRNEVPLNVSAVLNDTVGTLLSCAYEMDRTKRLPPCMIGLILGTGVNACYFERDADYYSYEGKIINIECGNFNRNLPLTNVDDEVDFAEVSNRGRQRLEKMVAGAYLGEICRRAVVKVLQHRAPEAAWVPFGLGSEHASAIIETTEKEQVGRIIKRVWGINMSIADCMVIKELCTTIFDRSAALAAVIIAGSAKKTQNLQQAMGGVTVAIDGSLYKCVASYRERVRAHLDSILGDLGRLVHLVMSDDGSGKGASVCASIVEQRGSSAAS